MKGFLIASILSVSTLFADGGFDIGQVLPREFLMIISVFAVFYFLMIRPQQKKTRAHQEVLKELRRGDRVVTAGGLLGTVDKIINDGEISLEIADNVKVRVVKATVTEVLAKTQPVAETVKTTAAKIAAPKMAKPVSAKPTKAIKKAATKAKAATNSAVKKTASKKPTKKSK